MVSLAHIDGVTPSRVFLPEGPYSTILDFLESRFPRGTRAGWEQRMLAGRVLSHDGLSLMPDTPYCARATIYYYREAPENFAIPFTEKIVFEDDYLLIADKPHFLPVTPVGPYIQETLLVRLRNKTQIPTLSCVHRLDLETAGLVMFTKQAHTRDQYAALFREKLIKKTYLAIAPLTHYTWPYVQQSRIEKSTQFMQMQEVNGEVNAMTEIHLIETHGALGLYQLKPLTGKKHQLRVHMSALNMPILHDQMYPKLEPYIHPELRDYSKPLQLLAHSLDFIDPITGQSRSFQTGLTLQWPKAIEVPS
jgi:tRNA pseudouridine32 synthase/23S rRNA pseudouridine746 synthase